MPHQPEHRSRPSSDSYPHVDAMETRHVKAATLAYGLVVILYIKLKQWVPAVSAGVGASAARIFDGP
jgi:hypothetical protein